MITLPANVKKENIKLYLRLKWFIIVGTVLLNIFEYANGFLSPARDSLVYLICFVAALPGLVVFWSIKRNKFLDVMTHISLVLDVLLIFLALYSEGGVENSWLFLPSVVAFLASYIFGFLPGILYAIYSFIVLAVMSAMQYFGVLPTYSPFNLGEAHWRNLQYMSETLLGMFLLYLSSAIAVGFLTQRAALRAERVDEYSGKIKAMSSNEANAKESLRHVKVELMVKNAELERLQGLSAERQLELVGLKSELERMRK